MEKFKSWFVLIFGVAIWVCDFLHYFGFYEFKNPKALSNDFESLFALLIGGILVLVSVVKLSGMLEKKAADLIDKAGK